MGYLSKSKRIKDYFYVLFKKFFMPIDAHLIYLVNNINILNLYIKNYIGVLYNYNNFIP